MQELKQKVIVRSIALHLAALGGGKKKFDIANKHLNRARKLGLKPGDEIAIDQARFKLVDNFAEAEEKGVAYRPARFARFTIEPVREPKKKKSGAAKTEAESQ